jgi:hypothetical protein
LIAGFIIGGSGGKVVIRGLGPALVPLGVRDALPDPVLHLYAGDRIIASNDNWTDGDAAALRAAGLALSTASRDAALVVDLAPGAYTTHLVSADSRNGIGLVEIYLVR